MIDHTCAGVLPVASQTEERAALVRLKRRALSRAGLRAKAAAAAARMAYPRKALALIACRPDETSVVGLLGALGAGHAAALLDAEPRSEIFQNALTQYRPEFLIGFPPAPGYVPAGEGEVSIQRGESGGDHRGEISPELAILLSTSGTTGSMKFVRLSGANVVANAWQIVTALDIEPNDVAIAHLPINYSYGLSVLTSHLIAGASVHLTPASFTDPEFWGAVRAVGGTHLPGVPFHYDFLARARLGELLPSSMKTLTQAGGALAPRLQKRMRRQVEEIGARFYVMYGQTEAAPRITTLPDAQHAAKLGSVGCVLQGGRLSIEGPEGEPLPPGEKGCVVYSGPNVMLGYAQGRVDLALGDVTHGRLATGDLGWLDEDGFLFLSGRANRIAKLYGLRISLDEVERQLSKAGDVAAVDAGERIELVAAAAAVAAVTARAPELAASYGIPAACFRIRVVEALPRRSSGKVDYAALKAGG